MPLRLLGSALAIASVVWGGVWSWALFADRDLDGPLMAVAWFPVVLSATAVPVQGRAGAVVRAVAAGVLHVWGMLLFAWMFLLAGVLMGGASVLAWADAEDAESSARSRPAA